MEQENYGYLFLLILIFAAGMYTAKLIQIRVTRDSLLQKYKPGTVQYDVIQKSLKPFRLVAGVLLTLLSMLALAVDVYKNKHFSSFFVILAFSFVVIIVGFIIAPRILKSYGRNS